MNTAIRPFRKLGLVSGAILTFALAVILPAWSAPAALAADPVVTISSPSTGAFLPGPEATIGFAAVGNGQLSIDCDIDTDVAAPVPCASATSHTFSALATGAHVATVTATDNASRTGSASVSFTIDPTNPVVTLTAPSSSALLGSSTVTAAFGLVEENPNTLQCSIDATPAIDCATGNAHEFSGVADGPHTISVTATDLAGRAGTASVSFTVDTSPPNLSITAPLDNAFVGVDSPVVTFSATDASAVTYECDVNSGGFSSCASPFQLSALPDGTHTVEVRATDAANNQSSDSATFTIDALNPVVTIESPTEDQVFNTADVDVSFTATDVNLFSVTCQIDSAPATACTSPHSFNGIADGNHSVSVATSDLAGRSATAVVNFSVDTSAPVIEIQSPTDGAQLQTDDVNVAFTVTDANEFDVTCDVDSGGFVPCASPLPLSDLPSGPHAVIVRAEDDLGHFSTETVTFAVDTVAPEVSISSPTASEYFNSTGVSVSFSATDTNLASVTCQLDGETASACASPQAFTGLSQGDHTVLVAATDQAGNVGQASVTFRVDSLLPVVDVTFPTAGAHVESTSVAVAFTATDASPLEVECDVDGAGFAPCSSPLNLTSLAEGPHSVVVRATDAATNTQSVTRSFTVDTVPPSVTISSPTASQYFKATSVPVSFTATDTNLAVVTCQLDGGAASPCTSPRNYASLAQGNHTVVVEATDQTGNAAQASVAFDVDSIEPVVDVTFPTAGAHVASTSVAVAFTTTDASPVTVECDVDSEGFLPCASPSNLTGLSQGPHSVVVRATDPAGNAHSITRNFTVDTVPPSVSISSPTAGQHVNSTSVPVSFAATDLSLTSVTCELDGGTASACTSPRNYAGLPQGNHTVVVAASDQAGNVGQLSVTFRVDTIAPEVSITAPAASQYLNSDDVNVNFTATDANSLTVECRVDSGTFAPCSSPYSMSDLSQGNHTAYVRATDPAMNATTQSVTFHVDTLAPDVSISSPTASQYFNSTNVPVSFSATDANLSSVTCQLDGGTASACTSPRNYSALGQGDHTVTVRAEDHAGNFSAASVTFRVDSVLPVVSISYPAAEQHVAATNVAVAFTATDANMLIVECDVDGVGFSTCSSPLNLTDLSQGAHSVVVRATDPAGNVHSVTRNFTVDTVLPAVSIASPTPGQHFNSTSVAASFTAADVNGVTTTCRLDSGSFAPCASPAATSGLAQGGHTLTIRAVDPAGNSTDAAVTFNVDSIQPVVNVAFPTAAAHLPSTSVAVAFTAADTNPLVVECSVDTADFATCSSPLNLSGLSQGGHTVIVRATDPAGNTHSITRDFTVDTVAPVVSISSPTAGQYFNSTSVPVNFSATDTNLASVTCQLDGGAATACTSPRNYTSLGQGDHTVVVRGVDHAGNSAQASITFRVDSIAPAVSITSPTTGQYFNTNAVNVNFTATDANALIVECRVDTGSYTACSSAYPLTGLTQGGHTAFVRATDPASNQTVKSVSFFIDTISPGVQISSPGSGAFLDSTTVTASFTATDANALTVECRLDSGAYTGCSSPASVSGVPQGAHIVSVRATDPAGNATTAVVNFTVDSIDPSVAFSAPTAGAHISSLDVDVDFSAADTNSPIVECRVDGGSYSTCANRLELTALSQGNHTVDVRATDPANNVTLQSRSFTVDTVVPNASITSPDPGEFFGGNKQVVRSFTASDTNLDRVECKLNNGPFTACTSGTQLNLADGEYTTLVRATDIAGNSTTSAPVSFSVDRLDPEIAVLSPVANGDFVSTATPAISFTATDGIYFAEDLTVECAVDGGGYSDCQPPAMIGPLSEGGHSVTIRVTDRADNVMTSTRSFIVDTIDPAVAITSPSTGSFHSIDEVSKNFTASDLNLDEVECSLDEAPFSACSTPVAYTDLPEGVHISRVRSRDLAGNVTERSVQFTIDTIAPVVTVTSPSVGQVVRSSDVAIAFAGNDATALSFECKVDGGAFSACGNPFTIPGLDEGTYGSTIRATDRAGNTSTGSVQFSVDLTSPDRTETLGVAKPKGKAPVKLTRKSLLIFRDEFSDPSINRRKWSTLRGTLKFPYSSSYNANKEAASYSRNNVAIENGQAVLTLKRKPEGEDPGHPYSSGMIHTGNHFSFKYGYVEARVKVPRCSGCWPAFWMLNAPVDEEWPPEIDVFEFFNTLKDKRPKTNVHWKAGGKNRQWGSKKYGDVKRNYTGGWHTYGLAWNRKRAQVFVDGEPGPIYKTSRHLPKKANYLIFNLALQKGFNPTGERKMAIDYVRVWK